MKYVIIQGDGMGDLLQRKEPGPTPLEAARTPNFDRLAGCGLFGLIHTIPEGMPPGSDVGNLSLFGYDPAQYYTGRSPLEAAAMGVELGPSDVSFRMNLVTLRENGGEVEMEDFSGGHIATEPAKGFITTLGEALGNGEFEFHPGVSYRHLLVWRGGLEAMETTPPHDITGQAIAPHLPRGAGAEELRRIMEASAELFAGHPLNNGREAAGGGGTGGKIISQVWLWGQGRAPSMPDFESSFHLKGAVISAVDLVRGVAVYAGFDVVNVPGATGFLDTDYRAKGEHALEALKTHDLVFLHVEAPDEAGHMGDREEKIRAIESIDEKILGPLLEELPALGPFKVLVVSDHATPVSMRTHSPDPVPFAMATSFQLGEERPSRKYGEAEAQKTGVEVMAGHSIIPRLIAWPE